MDSDFSVELGPPSEEATLELPWTSGIPGGPCYLDLKRHPELLALLEEAAQYSELADFLKSVNSRLSIFETAKCDVWSTEDLNEEERIYGAEWKVGSYIDVVFGEEQLSARTSFFRHEDVARSLTELLKKAPDVSAACEAVVRRCYYQETPPAAPAKPGGGESGCARHDEPSAARSGFYLTLYISGYGSDERHARGRWEIALRLVANALLQLSARMR